MTLYTAPNTTAGLDNMIVDSVTAVPIFAPMLLVFVFCVVFIAGSTAQKKRTGFADIPLWSTLASLSCLMVALAMSLVSGMISTLTLVIVVLLTILSGAWLFLGENNREV
jgi:uncharacterized membrane protein YhdT